MGSKSDRKEIAEIISAADVGLIPFSSDLRLNHSMSVKCLEYFACGIPVVATSHRDSVVSKIILENEIGLVSEPENVDALADALEKIYADKVFRNKAGAKARLLVQEKFDRSKLAEQFANLIKC